MIPLPQILTDFFIYLAESTICLLLFTLIYRLFLSKTTYFQWNRRYLLSSVFLALIIPLTPSPIGLYGNQNEIINAFHWNLSPAAWQTRGQPASPNQLFGKMQDSNQVIFLLGAIYLSGFSYKLWSFIKNLRVVIGLIQQSEKIQQESYFSVYTQTTLPTFSFMRHIFLGDAMIQLKQEELLQVILHEQVHVKQRHTLDLLLLEVVGIIFWFNPMINYLKKSLKLVHEYLVDAEVVRHQDLKQYSHLLLKLALQQTNFPIANSISNNQILNRITMLTQPKSGQIQKLRFLMAIPALVLTIASCSFLGDENNTLPTVAENVETKEIASDKKLPVRKITWVGNTLYTNAELDQALGIKKENKYDQKDIDALINDFAPSSLSNLYMDKGYLFYNANLKSKIVNNEMEVEVKIFEGEKAWINDLIIKGNNKVSKEEIVKQIGIQKGELFNRTKLINAQRILSKIGYFNPDKIGINPLPKQTPKGWIVDLEFVVEEQ
jgi:Zn-dependent protease with chaperone function